MITRSRDDDEKTLKLFCFTRILWTKIQKKKTHLPKPYTKIIIEMIIITNSHRSRYSDGRLVTKHIVLRPTDLKTMTFSKRIIRNIFQRRLWSYRTPVCYKNTRYTDFCRIRAAVCQRIRRSRFNHVYTSSSDRRTSVRKRARYRNDPIGNGVDHAEFFVSRA